MANPYPPFDLKVVRILDDSIHIKWETDNAIEFQPDIEYRVYQSNDGGASWDLVQTVKRREAVLDKRNDYSRTVVTTYTPALGESAQSTPIIIETPVTLTEDDMGHPIATDSDGRARYLLVDPDGRLSIGLDNVNVEISGMATEVKQDVVIASLGDINTELAAQHVDLNAFKDANHSDLVDIETAIAQLNTDLTQLDTNLLAFKAENNTNLNDIEADIEAFKIEAHSDAQALDVRIQNSTNAIQTTLNTLRTENDANLTEVKDAIDAASAQNNADLIDVEAAIDQLNTDNTAQNAALQSTVDAIKTNTDTIISELQVANSSKLIREEAVLTNVSTIANRTATLSWSKESLVHQITVIKEAGDATTWTVEVLNKSGTVTARNIVYCEAAYPVYDPNRFDLLKTMPYINIDGNDSIIVRVTPDTGTNNQFYVAVSGEKA